MINFAGTQRLYVKGTCTATCSDPKTGDIQFQSNKFNSGSITSNVNLNEIRAGMGNAVAAIIPSDAGLNVDFTAADFSQWAKSAQVGATMAYNGVAPVCQIVTAEGTGISIDASENVPCAQLGYSDIFCFVQEVGAGSNIAVDGTTYPLATNGTIRNFVAESGKKYKVWYFTKKANARITTISSMFDPKVTHFEVQAPVYANDGSGSTEGTRVGWLYVIVPYLKLAGDTTMTLDQSNPDTTKISGQAVAYDADIVSDTCADCESSVLAYYVYVPDDSTSNIDGLAVVGGVHEVRYTTSSQIPVRLVMADGSLVKPDGYSAGWTFATGDTYPTGTSMTASGMVTAGSVGGDFDVTATYIDGDLSLSTTLTVSIVSGN